MSDAMEMDCREPQTAAADPCTGQTVTSAQSPVASSVTAQRVHQKLKNLPEQCQPSVLVLGHVLGPISAGELQAAMYGDGPCALIIGDGSEAHINNQMISKVKRICGRLLHSDRVSSSDAFVDDIYKKFNSRVSELTQQFPDNNEGYRAYQSVLNAERLAASAFLDQQIRHT